MASIDDLFRKPTSSMSTTNKRKFPDHTSSSAYKSAKTSTNGSPYRPTVEDSDDAAIEAGPSLPPTETDNAAEEDEEDDDEEGRFFGSGVSADTRQALDYVEGAGNGEQEAGEEEVIDVAWLRRMAVGFERRITKNAELRARFEAEPEKYVGLLFSCNVSFAAGSMWSSVRWFMELWLILSFGLQVYDI